MKEDNVKIDTKTETNSKKAHHYPIVQKFYIDHWKKIQKERRCQLGRDALDLFLN